MKFSLIAAVVVLALAQGTFAQNAELDKITQYFEDFKTKMTSELTAIMNNQDLATQAETLKAQLEPYANKLRDAIDEHVMPLTENLQAQAKPVVENFQKQVEAIVQRATEHAKSLTN